MNDFRFKRFNIVQGNSAMRVNTDGVLLAAWMSMPLPQKIETESSGPLLPYGSRPLRMLDIGTGSGVLAIIAAQRMVEERVEERGAGHVTIDAVEIDENSCDDANLNFRVAERGFLEGKVKLNLYNMPIQEFCRKKTVSKMDDSLFGYDLIFSNPPYFVNSLKSEKVSKTVARHTDTLPQGDLIYTVCRLLRLAGRFALVLPTAEAADFIKKTELLKSAALGSTEVETSPYLELKRVCRVKTTARKEAKRLLMEFELCNGCGYSPGAAGGTAEKPECEAKIEEQTLVILENGEYTAEYKKLTAHFYMNF